MNGLVECSTLLFNIIEKRVAATVLKFHNLVHKGITHCIALCFATIKRNTTLGVINLKHA